jgi:hypothetical protein
MRGALGAALWRRPLPAQGADKRVPGKERMLTGRGWLGLIKPARGAHLEQYSHIYAIWQSGTPSRDHDRKLNPIGWAARRRAAELEFHLRKSGSRLESGDRNEIPQALRRTTCSV